jgi:mono/diheme cytochrome c family protein
LPSLLTTSAQPHSGGQAVFIKNCAHCHGSDGHGDEGPDLHNLDESDSWIANRIRNGKKGQMTAFAGKLEEDQINQVIGYLRTLK